jgi:hypothetical protein
MPDLQLPAKRKPGRPPVIVVHPEIKEQLIDIIRRGNYVSTAMTALGLSADFYYSCREQAEKGKPKFVEFVRDLKIAEAWAEIESVDQLRGGAKNWIAAATFLERRNRDDWGRSDRNHVNITVPIRVETVDYAKLAKEIKLSKAR